MSSPRKVKCIGCAKLAYEPIPLENKYRTAKVRVPYCTGSMVAVDTMVERECLAYETYD